MSDLVGLNLLGFGLSCVANTLSSSPWNIFHRRREAILGSNSIALRIKKADFGRRLLRDYEEVGGGG